MITAGGHRSVRLPVADTFVLGMGPGLLAVCVAAGPQSTVRCAAATDHVYAGLALAALAVILVVVPRNLAESPGNRGPDG